MSLLENVVSQVLKSGLGSAAAQPQNTGLGGLLDSLLGSQAQVGGLVGQMAGGNNAQLAGALGSLLGGNQNMGAGQLGSVLGQVLGGQKQQGFNKKTLLIALLPVVLGYIQKNGGLSGMMNALSGSGLGQKAQAWIQSIDTDNNGLDIDDVKRLFGREEIEGVCRETGASETEVCQGIADLLPTVVNELTPNGTLDSEAQADAEISDMLSAFTKANTTK